MLFRNVSKKVSSLDLLIPLNKNKNKAKQILCFLKMQQREFPI